jgi:predicted membrane protein
VEIVFILIVLITVVAVTGEHVLRWLLHRVRRALRIDADYRPAIEIALLLVLGALMIALSVLPFEGMLAFWTWLLVAYLIFCAAVVGGRLLNFGATVMRRKRQRRIVLIQHSEDYLLEHNGDLFVLGDDGEIMKVGSKSRGLQR